MPSVPLYSAATLRAIEAEAIAFAGAGGDVLMQRAGTAGWRALLAHWPQARRIVVACGPGNNGGDGYVLARHALEAGWHVQVWRLPRHAPATALARAACDAYCAAGGCIAHELACLADADVIVDAIFGIGLSRAPDDDVAAMIGAINASAAPVLALDLPSGVDGDSGAVPGAAVHATVVLELLGRHPGLHTGDALDHFAVCAYDALGVGAAVFAQAPASARLLSPSMLRDALPTRRRNSHKGEQGRVLCLGGGVGTGGAIALCAEAALRCGAGLVSVATWPAHVAPLLARLPEAMVRGIESASGLADMLVQADVVALGPGLGKDAWARSVFDAAFAARKPCVIDADALNLLAEAPRDVPAASILTPHPGEAARLLQCDVAAVQRDRHSAAMRLAQRFGSVVVLKGAGSIVAAPGEVPCIVGAGNPGMAVGGMGDVLTGVIAALRAQGLPPFEAATCGAMLHAAAGDLAVGEGGERGLLASDLMPLLRRLANSRRGTRA